MGTRKSDAQTKPSKTEMEEPCQKHNCVIVKQVGICCDFCNKWFHQKCTEFHPKEFTFLQKSSSKNIKWFCEICNENVEMKTKLNCQHLENTFQSKQFLDEIKITLNSIKLELKNEINSQKQNLCEKVQSYSEVVKQNLNQNKNRKEEIFNINMNLKLVKMNIINKLDN